MPSTKTEPLFSMVYIHSQGIETYPVEVPTLSFDGTVQIKRCLRGSINSQPFQIFCDEPVEVSTEIAQVLAPLIERQALLQWMG